MNFSVFFQLLGTFWKKIFKSILLNNFKKISLSVTISHAPQWNIFYDYTPLDIVSLAVITTQWMANCEKKQKKREGKGKELQNQPQKQRESLCKCIKTNEKTTEECWGHKVINVLFMFQLRLSFKDRNHKMNIHRVVLKSFSSPHSTFFAHFTPAIQFIARRHP